MSLLNKFFKLITKHKVIFVIVCLAVIGGGYYTVKALNGNTVETKYVLAAVDKGTLIATVSGSGQISASQQVDVKAKASGDVYSVLVKNGQEIKAGAVIAQLNTQEAYKTVRDAQANLTSAKLSLEKFKQPATTATIIQAENALISASSTLAKLKLSQKTDYAQALEAKKKAEDAIAKSYEDTFNTISNAFLNLPTIITKLNDVLYSTDISASEVSVGTNQWNMSALMNVVDIDDRDNMTAFQISAESDYKTARVKYDTNFVSYKKVTRYSDKATIEDLLKETIDTTKTIAQSAKSESNYLDAWADYRSQNHKTVFTTVKDYQSNLSTYIGQTNTHLSSLLSAQNTLQTNQDTLTNAIRDIEKLVQNNPLDLAAAEASVKEKILALANLKVGPDSIDLQTQELTVKQRENTLYDAQVKLADYTVRAPFDGVVAKVNIKVGDSLSSGGAAITLITKQRMAEISLNEVDVARIKVGQKVTLTFDAIENLSITGKVAEIDSLGTVSQGVVTYSVKIIFDTQDDRVKSGMSVSAVIITNIKQDVLLVSNSAIKTSGSVSYVEMLDIVLATSSQAYADAIKGTGITSATPPKQQTVTVGLANDTKTEIVSGLKLGDQIIIRTVSQASSQTSKTSGQNLFQMGGGGTRSAVR